MTTFADLSTLLLTFFIIMLSMANIDIQNFRDMLGSVKDAFGVQVKERGEYQAVVKEVEKPKVKQEDPADDNVKTAEKTEREEASKDISDAIKQTNMGELAQVSMGSRGIRIRVKGKLLFDPAQANIKIQAKPFLDSLVKVMKKFKYFLLVEGHTDSSPISTDRFPSNWELSGARASSVLRYLTMKDIDQKRLASVALADIYPIALNKTKEGRMKNRRVEFVLTKQPFRTEIQ